MRHTSSIALLLLLAAAAVVGADRDDDVRLQMLLADVDAVEASRARPAASSRRTAVTQAIVDGLHNLGASTQQLLKDTAVAHRRLFLQLQSGNGTTTSPSASATCDTTAYNAALQSFGQKCQNWKVDPIFDFNTDDNASVALVEGVCSNDCAPQLAMLLKNFSACMSTELKMIARVVKTLCVRDTTTRDRCAVTLKMFKYLGCDNRTTKATCEANGFQCQWAPDNKCQPKGTDAFLEKFCRPCLNAFMAWALRSNPVELKFLQAYVQQVWCRKIDGSFCMPLLSYYWADNNTLAFKSSSAVTTGFLDKTCLGTSGKCFRSVASVFVRVSFETGRDTLRTCVKAAQSAAVRRFCFFNFNDNLNNLLRIRKLFRQMCVVNQRGNYCISEHVRLVDETPCFTAFAATAVCNATCSRVLGDQLMAMGCCKELVHDWVYGPADYLNPKLLPKGAKDLAPDPPVVRPYNKTNLTSIRDHIYGYLRFCPSVNDNSTIIADLWDRCPRRRNTNTTLSLKLRLPWALMKDDDDLKSKVTEALQYDLALSVSAGGDDVADGTLAEDTSSTVTVVTTSAHGFTTLSTSSGISYTTTSSADDSASASTQSSTFNEQVSSNSLVLATTSGVVAGECSNCLGADDASLLAAGNDDTVVAGDLGAATTTTTTTTAPKKGLFSAAGDRVFFVTALTLLFSALITL